MPDRYVLYVSCIPGEFNNHWHELSREMRKISLQDHLMIFYAKVDNPLADISHAKNTLEKFCENHSISCIKHDSAYELQTSAFCNMSYWTFGSKVMHENYYCYQSPDKNFYYVVIPDI
jgi:hypothetical protein